MKTLKRIGLILLLTLGMGASIFGATTPVTSSASNPLNLVVPSGIYKFGFYDSSSRTTKKDILPLAASNATISSTGASGTWKNADFMYRAYGTFYVGWHVLSSAAFDLVLVTPELKNASNESIPYIINGDKNYTDVSDSAGSVVASFPAGAITSGSAGYYVLVDLKDAKLQTYSAVYTLKVVVK